jgi:hypothetical protein
MQQAHMPAVLKDSEEETDTELVPNMLSQKQEVVIRSHRRYQSKAHASLSKAR